MIQTSEKWRIAQSGVIVPEAFIEIAYKITDPDLHESASETNNGVSEYSVHERIVETTVSDQERYATLEHNAWALDGNTEFISDDSDTGYVSGIVSNADGRFAANPLITIGFDKVHVLPIPGVTITWGNGFADYAEQFKLTAYNGNAVILSRTFNGTAVQTECDFVVTNYNRITIEILKWSLPHRKARVQRIFLGIRQTFTKSDLVSYEHDQSADLLSAALPKNAATFSLNNVDGKWNPDNPTGNVRYLAERQEIKVRYGLKLDDTIEWIEAGTFWVSEWDTPSNGIEARFTARDAIEFMSEPYSGTLNGTLYEIVLAAFEQSELPVLDNGNPRYVISDNLKEYRADVPEDKRSEHTCAEIVQMCANAACCVFYQDRFGVIHVEPLRENASGYRIARYNCYTHPEFTLSKQLKAVNVNNGMSVVNNSATGEVQAIHNELITNDTAARRVAEWTRKTLMGRKTISGEYRADPSLDVLDKVAAESKYGSNNALYITDIKYTYNGAFKGVYTGRITDFDKEVWYSGELVSGEV